MTFTLDAIRDNGLWREYARNIKRIDHMGERTITHLVLLLDPIVFVHPWKRQVKQTVWDRAKALGMETPVYR